MKENRRKATRYLQNKLKVDVRTNTTITSLDGDKLQFENGDSINASTVIWTAGVVKACNVTSTMDLQKEVCLLKWMNTLRLKVLITYML